MQVAFLTLMQIRHLRDVTMYTVYSDYNGSVCKELRVNTEEPSGKVMVIVGTDFQPTFGCTC